MWFVIWSSKIDIKYFPFQNSHLKITANSLILYMWALRTTKYWFSTCKIQIRATRDLEERCKEKPFGKVALVRTNNIKPLTQQKYAKEWSNWL